MPTNTQSMATRRSLQGQNERKEEEEEEKVVRSSPHQAELPTCVVQSTTITVFISHRRIEVNMSPSGRNKCGRKYKIPSKRRRFSNVNRRKFNQLEEDAANWTFFRMVGNKLHLKHDVVPHLNMDNPRTVSNESQVGAEYRKMKENLLSKLSTIRQDNCQTKKPTRTSIAVQTIDLVKSGDDCDVDDVDADADWKQDEFSEDDQTFGGYVSSTARTKNPENACTVDVTRSIDYPVWECDLGIHTEEPPEDYGTSNGEDISLWSSGRKENLYNRARREEQISVIPAEEIVTESDDGPVLECDVGIPTEKPPEDGGTSKKNSYNRARRKQQIKAIATEEIFEESLDGPVWVCHARIPAVESLEKERTSKENNGNRAKSERSTAEARTHLQPVLTADSVAVDRTSGNSPFRECDVRIYSEGSSEDEGSSDENVFAENVCNRAKRKRPTVGLATQEPAVDRTGEDDPVWDCHVRIHTDISSEDEGTSKEFKAHKLKVKRLKRTAVPTLQLPSTVEVIDDKDERPLPLVPAAENNNQQQSESDKYSIGSYVCTTCGHLSSSESSFFEHLNSHVKVESHDKGDAVEVKVEPDESSYLLEEDETGLGGEDEYLSNEIDPLGQDSHPNDADGGIVEDDQRSDMSCEDDENPCGDDEPFQQTEEEDRLDRASVEDDHNVVGTTFIHLGNKIRKISRRRLKWVLGRLLNKTYWDSQQRLVHYPPFSRQKVEQGEAVYWSNDRPRFKCKRCPFMAQTSRLFNVHLQTHADGRQFGCSTCQSYFDSEESLIASHTSGGTACSRIEIIDFHIRCEECWEYYKNHQELVYHVVFDSCVRRTKAACPVCNMEVVKFRMENHLKNHKSKAAQ